MNFSSSNCVTVNEILADILKSVKDSDFKANSKGWYTSQIQQSLEELSFDTFFDERNEVLKIPSNLRLEMPKGAFNVRQMYAFSGEKCNVSSRKNIWHKKNYINNPEGKGLFARNNGDNTGDSFHQKGTQHRGVLYYSIQQGLIMLSSSCLNHENIMLVYNGVGCEVGDAPMVPNFLRQAVKDYVTVRALESIIAESEPAMMNKWNLLYGIHSNRLNKPYDGSWAKAEHRAKTMDHKERQDLKEYLSQIDY